jgi:hypothetical protein
MSEKVEVAWRPREPPLAPVCALALGAAARALAARLLARPDAELVRLRGAASAELLAVLGEPEWLPWADGVTYLGRDPEAPALLLPVHLAPRLHPALLERALLARAAAGAPLAVLPESSRLVPLGGARPLHRDALRAWAEGTP